jgi:hypothetical protein
MDPRLSSARKDVNAGNPARPGLYGFALSADGPIDGLGAWCVPAPHEWPTLHLRREPRAEQDAHLAHHSQFGATPELGTQARTASVELPEGRMTMRRDSFEVRFETSTPPSIDELVHPLIGYAALAFSDWLGRDAFHAGVFLSGGRAWAMLGERGSGKSSTLAWIARQRQSVIADDLLFLDGRTAFVGPRAIDLAAASATHLGWEGELEDVRRGFRRRLALDALSAEHKLAGWISLKWGERVSLTPVPPPERVPLLVEHGHHPNGTADWSRVLALAALPTLELCRPRTLASLDQAGELLLGETAKIGAE